MATKALSTALVISAGNPTEIWMPVWEPPSTGCSGVLVGSHLSHNLSLDANSSQISFFCCFSYFAVFTAVGQLLISG